MNAALVAASSLIVAVATLTTSIGGLIILFRKQTKNEEKVTEVHEIVNSQRSEMVARISALQEALVDAGIDVPEGKP